MASSPPYHNTIPSISPPYPSNAQLPQPPKRRQSDMPTAGPPIKRRKASMLSTTSASSHPLRQTSFPPEIENTQTPRYSRSPSMDTTSLASGVSGRKKKRPRKSKGKANDDDSIVGGKARSTTSANSARGRAARRQSREESAEEEEDELALDRVEDTTEEAQREREQQAMLVSAFDKAQAGRHGAWKASRLGDAVVRRIINQTLSQSVPHSVILAVRGAAKVYAGELISSARNIQAQWDGVDPEFVTPSEGKDWHGPLLPEHLAEAYRRHREGKEAGCVGQLGLWQLQQSSGVERFGPKVGGKRLFK